MANKIKSEDGHLKHASAKEAQPRIRKRDSFQQPNPKTKTPEHALERSQHGLREGEHLGRRTPRPERGLKR